MPDQAQSISRPDVHWKSPPAEDRCWVEFDSEYVLFHRPSGRTHFLNHAAFLLLEDILADPRDAAAAADQLAQAHGETIKEGSPAQVWALLQRLEELGLVERA